MSAKPQGRFSEGERLKLKLVHPLEVSYCKLLFSCDSNLSSPNPDIPRVGRGGPARGRRWGEASQAGQGADESVCTENNRPSFISDRRRHLFCMTLRTHGHRNAYVNNEKIVETKTRISHGRAGSGRCREEPRGGAKQDGTPMSRFAEGTAILFVLQDTEDNCSQYSVRKHEQGKPYLNRWWNNPRLTSGLSAGPLFIPGC